MCLWRYCYDELHVTGYFGVKTFNALVKYQKSVGLPQTGYFGVMTREGEWALILHPNQYRNDHRRFVGAGEEIARHHIGEIIFHIIQINRIHIVR